MAEDEEERIYLVFSFSKRHIASNRSLGLLRRANPLLIPAKTQPRASRVPTEGVGLRGFVLHRGARRHGRSNASHALPV